MAVSKYPKLAKLLQDAIDKLDLTTAKAAEKANYGKKYQTFYSWVSGARAPRNDKDFKNLGLLSKDEDRKAEFIEKLKRAVQLDSGRTGRSARGEVIPEKLRVATVDYIPFSGHKECFFDDVFRRFLAFASIGSDDPFPTIRIEDVEARLADGHPQQVDVVLGILATPDRTRFMRFFPSPVRVPLNAAFLVPQVKGQENQPLDQGVKKKFVRDALLNSAGSQVTQKVRPIAVVGEVGGLYAKHFLNLNQGSQWVTCKSYSPKEYLSELQTSAKASSNGATPIVLADDLMCRRIVKAIENAGSSGQLAEDYSTWPTTGTGQLPTYRLTIAMNRERQELWNFLAESLEIYLTSNVEQVKSAYMNLRESLKTMPDALQLQQKEADTCLSLREPFNRAVPPTDPWYPMVTRAAFSIGANNEDQNVQKEDNSSNFESHATKPN